MKTTLLTAKRLLSLTLLTLAIFILIIVASAAAFPPMVWLNPWVLLQGSAGSKQPQNKRVIQEDLAFWVELPAEVSVGSPVPIRLKVKNVGDHTINLSLGGCDRTIPKTYAACGCG